MQAWNQDLPYDQFVVWQLAGDQLLDNASSSSQRGAAEISAEARQQRLVATGFLRLGTWNDEPNDPADYVYDRLEDLVHTTSSVLLGLSVKCARCHDHKFDPIAQEDYYRVAACFWTGPIQPRDRGLLGGPTAEELGAEHILGWTDVGANEALNLLRNGERKQPVRPVEPGALAALKLRELPGAFAANQANRHRLQLARWIVDPHNPLAARVIVNRLWQHHFGAGLVGTPDNFGFRGEPPTHPELLDWLASELIRHEWSLKHIHRLILTSRTYCMASTHPRELEYARLDAGNLHRWRFARRRLDAEALRDQLLSASGQLDTRLGGPSFRPEIAAEALEGLSRKQADWSPSPLAEQQRRSLYLYSKRGLLSPFMTTFDFADTTLPCGRRESTTAPTQALAMMNNPLTHRASQAMAARLLREAPRSLEARLTQVWRWALGRAPRDDERQAAADHVRDQGERFARQPPTADDAAGESPELLAWTSLCHVLMNCNEFLYVD